MIEARSQLGNPGGDRRGAAPPLRRADRRTRCCLAARRELQTIIETSKTEVSRTSTAQIKLRELQQDVATSREVLSTFLQRAKETREQEQISIPMPASFRRHCSGVPSWPVNILVLGLGAFAGLGFGVVRALAGEAVGSDRAIDLARSGTERARAVPSAVAGERTSSLLKLGRRGAMLRAESGDGELGRALVAVSEPDGPADGAYRRASCNCSRHSNRIATRIIRPPS